MAVFSVYFNIIDNKGNSSRVEIPLPGTVAMADLPGAVQAFGALVDPLITGGLRNAGFTVEVDIPGFSGLAGTLSDVQEKATFALRTAGGYLKRLGLPTFNETLIIPASSAVNTAQADVAAFVDALEGGVTVNGHVILPCDYRGDDLASLESAYEDWGRRR